MDFRHFGSGSGHPGVGWSDRLGNGYAPLGVMLILHIITMAVSSRAGVKNTAASSGSSPPASAGFPSGLDPPRSHRHRPDPDAAKK